MSEPTPIQRFLGLARDTVSPFELLGIEPDSCDEPRVREALSRRLARVARHPETRSHDADEVRLALHAAAAQILDPSVRAALVAAPELTTRDIVIESETAPRAPDAFDTLAARTIARAGGWNTESQRSLAMLAHAHGIDERALRDRLRRIASGGARQARAPGEHSGTRATTAERISAARPRRQARLSIGHVTLIGSATTLAVVVVGALLLREAARSASAPDRSNAPAAVDGRSSEPAPTDAAPPLRSSSDPTGAVLATPEAIVRWLERASEERAEDPGQAAWRFERAVEALAERWPSMPVDARRRAGGLVRAAMHAADTGAASGLRALDAIARGLESFANDSAPRDASAVRAAVWSAAMLAALVSDPDTGAGLRNLIIERHRGAIGSAPADARSFEEGVLASATGVASRLIAAHEAGRAPSADAWSAWVECLDRVAESSDEAATRERLALFAAGALLRSRASVAADPAANAALTALLSRVKWRSGTTGETPPAHSAVMAWFDEPAVRAADLAAATEWIAARSGAPGVSSSMTLGRTSIPESRVALRERYARAWGLDSATEARGFAALWARTARETLDAPDRSSSIDTLARIVVAARLNAAAGLRWEGASTEAGSILVDLAGPVSSAMRPGAAPPRVRDADPTRDGVWGLRFLSTPASDTAARLVHIADLGRRSGPLGPVDSDVLVAAALRNPVGEVRDAAREAVVRRASEPGVLASILDHIPVSPRTEPTTALVRAVTRASVVAPTEPTWPIEIRAALLDRLLESLATNDPASVVDRLADVLVQTYEFGADAIPAAQRGTFGAESVSGSVTAVPARAPEDAAADRWLRWRDAAVRAAPNPRAPAPIDEIIRRANARARLAAGSVERFAAWQWSVADAMAFVISGERPSRAAEVAAVVAALESHRRASAGVLEQIEHTEVAMAQLWAIRYGLSADDPIPTSRAVASAPQAAARPGAAASPLDVIAPALLDTPLGAFVRERAESIEDDDALAVFELAEDVTARADSPAWRDAAKALFILAFEIDRGDDGRAGVGASVCLALAELSTAADEKRWLLALAVSLDPASAAGMPVIDDASPDARARLALAEALELYRLGEYRESQRRLEAPGVSAALELFAAALTGGARAIREELATENTCRQCRNARIIPDQSADATHRLCPTCGGDPGPDLADAALVEHLRLERLLLGGAAGAWSADLAINFGRAMRDADPADLLGSSPR